MALRDQGLSLTQISRVMMAEGWPTPGGRLQWSKSHVDRLLHTRHVRELIGEGSAAVLAV
ncbi:recombinase family protein [Nonomuraea sp. 3-1Str]|uniref:hypothetical protein n=1 Tax=Nonomuraea sp. 3-1Str TaxID=2929801 RepID=UPI00285E87CB|nr:hypothetical protein [Nonomuraea sp. 3-1Str]MDR8409483.1 recombinase family protein [Nonomuraea sp. 3-1Str]